MKLLVVESGLDIILNTNEKNKETVFAINDDGTHQNFFTYQTIIDVDDKEKYSQLLQSYETCIIPAGFLFYSFQFQISYCHFLMQTLPKLTSYSNEIPLLVPAHFYNELHRNIFALLGITNIILLYTGIYDIGHLMQGKVYGAMPSPYTSDHLAIYSLLRTKLNIEPCIRTRRRNIYLQRDGIPSKEFNNSETGSYRKIMNEPELIAHLQERDFEIIVLGQSSLQEKSLLLQDADVVITPLGSNIMNFIFANAPRFFIFLSNSLCFGDSYIVDLLADLGEPRPQYKTLHYPPIQHLGDPLNAMNCPFNVNIDEVLTTVAAIMEP
jgi:capsular polysaccharide biosynthesis protein